MRQVSRLFANPKLERAKVFPKERSALFPPPMKRMLPFIAALCAPLMLCAAAERILDASLTQVTVFADRAEVVREAQLELPAGTHTLIFPNLPTQTDTTSLQVNGTGGFSLQDVRFETRQLSELPEGRLKELTKTLEGYNTRAKALGLAASRVKDSRSALEAIIGRLTTPPKESTEPPVMDVNRWGELLAFYNTQLESLDKAQLSNDADLTQVNDDIARVRREISQLNAQAGKISNTAKVVVVLEAPAKITVDLSSIVSGPRWTPSYDIRANTAAKQVSLSAYGNITQNTGEVWDNVRLRLSTAQPQIGGREPQLSPWFVQRYEPAPEPVVVVNPRKSRALYAAGAAMNQMMATDGSFSRGFAEADKESPMRVSEASVQTGATAVVYEIPGTAVIPDDNQSVRVAITTQTFPGYFRYSAVPKLSPYVYLKTKVVNTSHTFSCRGPATSISTAPLWARPPWI